MEEATISIIISVIALLLSALAYFKNNGNNGKLPADIPFNSLPLQLQAYERLVVLCERIAMPNLISRVSQPDLSAREMQIFLIEGIKQEYEYNASQQVYVTARAWDAVRSLKDQNMLMINQIANVLPPDAKARDLNKKLLEVEMDQEQKPLHTVVLETLNAEAKRLMNN
jgi:hypothetical protein